MRRPKFTIRTLLLLTLVAAVILVLVRAIFHRNPRSYLSRDELVARHTWDEGWRIEVAPDIPGPYRLAGDDRVSAGVFHVNEGVGCSARVTAGNRTRTFGFLGSPGISRLVFPLETRSDLPTYMILSKATGTTHDPKGLKE